MCRWFMEEVVQGGGSIGPTHPVTTAEIKIELCISSGTTDGSEVVDSVYKS
jgi:hypothetical protein